MCGRLVKGEPLSLSNFLFSLSIFSLSAPREIREEIRSMCVGSSFSSFFSLRFKVRSNGTLIQGLLSLSLSFCLSFSFLEQERKKKREVFLKRLQFFHFLSFYSLLFVFLRWPIFFSLLSLTFSFSLSLSFPHFFRDSEREKKCKDRRSKKKKKVLVVTFALFVDLLLFELFERERKEKIFLFTFFFSLSR